MIAERAFMSSGIQQCAEKKMNDLSRSTSYWQHEPERTNLRTVYLAACQVSSEWSQLQHPGPGFKEHQHFLITAMISNYTLCYYGVVTQVQSPHASLFISVCSLADTSKAQIQPQDYHTSIRWGLWTDFNLTVWSFTGGRKQRKAPSNKKPQAADKC